MTCHGPRPPVSRPSPPQPPQPPAFLVKKYDSPHAEYFNRRRLIVAPITNYTHTALHTSCSTIQVFDEVCARDHNYMYLPAKHLQSQRSAKITGLTYCTKNPHQYLLFLLIISYEESSPQPGGYFYPSTSSTSTKPMLTLQYSTGTSTEPVPTVQYSTGTHVRRMDTSIGATQPKRTSHERPWCSSDDATETDAAASRATLERSFVNSLYPRVPHWLYTKQTRQGSSCYFLPRYKYNSRLNYYTGALQRCGSLLRTLLCWRLTFSGGSPENIDTADN